MAALGPSVDTASRRGLLDDLDRRFAGRALRARRLQVAIRRHRLSLQQRFDQVGKRVVDVALAGVVLTLLSPVLLVLAAWLVRRGRVFDRVRCLGREGAVFDRLTFTAPAGRAGTLVRKSGTHRLALLFNVLRGEMSLVGPRAVPVQQVSAPDRVARIRDGVRPGIVGPWWVRQRTNVAYGSEIEIDGEYAHTWSVRGDLGLLVRAALALAYGSDRSEDAPGRVSMLGVSIDNVTMDDALGAVDGWLGTSGAHQVAFVNADCLNIACRNDSYRRVLQQSTLTLGDGIGLKIGGTLLRRPIRQNVNGTDLFPRLCELARRRGARMFLLGARPEVVEGVGEWIRARHGASTVCGVHHGYFDTAGERAVIEQVRAAQPDILLVALGAPRQDEWLAANLEATGATVGIGVGGLFDFYSGRIPRAPVWMRELGLEWAFRLYQEPRRMWRRYLVGNLQFVTRVLRERWSTASPLAES